MPRCFSKPFLAVEELIKWMPQASVASLKRCLSPWKLQALPSATS